MRLRHWIVSVVLLAGLAGATGYVLAREPDVAGNGSRFRRW